MKAAVLFSGGKDSLYALWVSMNQGYDISCLITLIPESFESWVFHYPAAGFTSLQAEALNKPILVKRTGDSAQKSLKDLRVLLRRAIKEFNIDSVVSGVLASDYQREFVNTLCEELGLRSYTPLWGKRGDILLAEILDMGFLVMIISVAAEGLTEKWLGRILDSNSLRELIRLASKYRFNPSGEGGEYETLVLDAPVFRKRLCVGKAEPVWMGDSGYLKIEEAYLESKNSGVY